MAEESTDHDAAGRGDESVLDGVLPLFDHTHDTLTTAVVVAFAAAVGLLAGWITADFGVRTPVFVVAAVGTGYLLYTQSTRRAVLAAGLYSLATLLAVAPFLYELGLIVAVDSPLRHVLSLADLVIFLVFWVVAVVPALVGNRVANGPLLPQVWARIGI
ncbi:MAG: hypothetical protein V5A18_04600 [Haloarculaceae archaeon]